MKKLISVAVLALLAFSATAQEVIITGSDFGSHPGNATKWDNDVFHAPQYMPGYPTSAVLFPRVVDVECTKQPNGGLKCNGYNWLPEYGRGEYLMIHPVVKEDPKPVPPVVVIKEVPVKKKGE